MTDPGISPPAAPGTEMCALTLIYYQEFELIVHSLIQQHMGVPRYTKISDVVGARLYTMGDSDETPSPTYHMLTLFAEREVIYKLADELRELRRRKGHGLRGYITPVEAII